MLWRLELYHETRPNKTCFHESYIPTERGRDEEIDKIISLHPKHTMKCINKYKVQGTLSYMAYIGKQ